MGAFALETQLDANSFGSPVPRPNHAPNFLLDTLPATTLSILSWLATGRC